MNPTRSGSPSNESAEEPSSPAPEIARLPCEIGCVLRDAPLPLFVLSLRLLKLLLDAEPVRLPLYLDLALGRRAFPARVAGECERFPSESSSSAALKRTVECVGIGCWRGECRLDARSRCEHCIGRAYWRNRRRAEVGKRVCHWRNRCGSARCRGAGGCGRGGGCRSRLVRVLHQVREGLGDLPHPHRSRVPSAVCKTNRELCCCLFGRQALTAQSDVVVHASLHESRINRRLVFGGSRSHGLWA